MPIRIYEPSNNGDDSVLITDLRKCRSIKDVDRYIDKITRKKSIMDKAINGSEQMKADKFVIASEETNSEK